MIQTRSTDGESAAMNQYIDDISTKARLISRYDGYSGAYVSNDYYTLTYSNGWILTLKKKCFDTQTWKEIAQGTQYKWAYNVYVNYWFLFE